MTKAEEIAEVRAHLFDLQIWFASRPCGFRENGTDEQRQQFIDRERENDRLQERLANLEGRP